MAVYVLNYLNISAVSCDMKAVWSLCDSVLCHPDDVCCQELLENDQEKTRADVPDVLIVLPEVVQHSMT
jgi:hypothetical protein